MTDIHQGGKGSKITGGGHSSWLATPTDQQSEADVHYDRFAEDILNYRKEICKI